MSARESCGRYAFVGLGKTKIGYQPEYNGRMLEAEAARLALEDAGLMPGDIDGAIHCKQEGGLNMQGFWHDAFPRILGMPVNFYFSISRGGAGATVALTTAIGFLELGLANYVCIGYASDALTQWRKRSSEGTLNETENREDWAGYFGGTVAASSHAFLAARHMHEYGTTSPQLGAISVSERQWACLNPDAQMYGRPITIDDHQNSPWVVWPYHLLDISLISDSGCAVIITTAERARDCAKKPVYIMGVGFGEQIRKDWWEKTNYTKLDVERAKEKAFAMARIELSDIDVALLYDCFTAEVLLQLEDYGWCKKGEGGPFVEAGNIAPGGAIPVNTGGGLLSYGHLIDFTGLIEAILQLRGEARERQLKNVEVALVTGHGGEILDYGMSCIHGTVVLGEIEMKENQVSEKPIPVVETDTAPFWEALKRHEFRIFRCKQCGTWYFPAAYCRNHVNEPFYGNMEWAIASGKGKVFAFLIHYRAFHYGFRNDVPYVYALIELDEGPMMSSNIVGCEPSQVYIGMPVEVVFEDRRGIRNGNEVSFTLPQFCPGRGFKKE